MKAYIEVTWTETRRVVVLVDADSEQQFEDEAYGLVHSSGYDAHSEFVEQGETTCEELDEKEGKARAVNESGGPADVG